MNYQDANAMTEKCALYAVRILMHAFERLWQEHFSTNADQRPEHQSSLIFRGRIEWTDDEGREWVIPMTAQVGGYGSQIAQVVGSKEANNV